MKKQATRHPATVLIFRCPSYHYRWTVALLLLANHACHVYWRGLSQDSVHKLYSSMGTAKSTAFSSRKNQFVHLILQYACRIYSFLRHFKHSYSSYHLFLPLTSNFNLTISFNLFLFPFPPPPIPHLPPQKKITERTTNKF